MFTLEKNEKNEILKKHKKLFIEATFQQPAKSITFDLLGKTKNYGKATIVMGESKGIDDPESTFNRYILVFNKKPILVYGDYGLISGPSNALNLMKALNISEFDYNAISTTIEDNFKKIGIEVSIPKLKML